MDSFDRGENERKVNELLAREDPAAKRLPKPGLKHGPKQPRDEDTFSYGETLNLNDASLEPSAQEKQRWLAIALPFLTAALGFAVATLLIPNPNQELLDKQQQLIEDNEALRLENQKLRVKNQALRNGDGPHSQTRQQKSNSEAQIAHFKTQAQRYASALQSQGTQAGAETIRLWSEEWASLLSNPTPKPLIDRAEKLERLLARMSNNLDPADYMRWQREFLSSQWIPGLSFDADGDGLPTTSPTTPLRSQSVEILPACRWLMVLNQLNTKNTFLAGRSLRCGWDENLVSLSWKKQPSRTALSEIRSTFQSQGYVFKESKPGLWVVGLSR